ncbi:hypothetical protein HW555_008476 [Spodoptera exigua]|uniref:Uncharacterized protein n=1 Tax=Spodoptera exigua TaxID=7107 RepID=A0A835GCY3_SPOEX|nr:hypothetical protein HW555_008476 [Spodoptera exigua]
MVWSFDIINASRVVKNSSISHHFFNDQRSSPWKINVATEHKEDGEVVPVQRVSPYKELNNFINLVKSSAHISEMQRLDLQERFNKFDSLHSQFDELQTEIELLADDAETAFVEREEFDRQFFNLVALTRSLLGSSVNGAGSEAGFKDADSVQLKLTYSVALKTCLPIHYYTLNLFAQKWDSFVCVTDHIDKRNTEGVTSESPANLDDLTKCNENFCEPIVVPMFCRPIRGEARLSKSPSTSLSFNEVSRWMTSALKINQRFFKDLILETRVF